MQRIAGLFDWLIDGAPDASTSIDVVERMGRELTAAGIPVYRIAAFVTTLHPTVVGRAFIWSKGAPARVGELTRAAQQSPMFLQSPVALVFRTQREVRSRLLNLTPTDYAALHELAASGFTDYLCLPLKFKSGETHAIAFATTHPAGFEEADLADLRQVVRPLARLAEILALRRVASNLLSTYVGRNSGDRILAGQIFRGDIETIRAIIWFSDLRGFTELSARAAPREIVDTLNDLFECQVVAIERHGGEVLKFMGDGLLAVFPISDGDAAARANAALQAANDAQTACAKRNREAQSAIEFGLALHIGEVAYGNIGGASRLDFTVIGSAVNLASRLEGMTGKLKRPIVLSADLAQLLEGRLENLGQFDLKGVAGAQAIFAPTA